MNQLDLYFEKMWNDYGKLNPQARAVYQSLTQAGEKVVNDHIAFRTFSHPKISIDILAQHFIKYGYVQKANYVFSEKKLNAKHYEHPEGHYPKVFISELDLKLVSPLISTAVSRMCEYVLDTMVQDENFLIGGRPWMASFDLYQKIASESEYAAWVYAHGFRPNHFTVYINHLKKLNQIQDLNQFLKEHGFKLNNFGGEIKGSPADYLEQSSTMANQIETQFEEGVFKVPACYYEFAKRYTLPSGELFEGFVARSADKIFESTNK